MVGWKEFRVNSCGSGFSTAIHPENSTQTDSVFLLPPIARRSVGHAGGDGVGAGAGALHGSFLVGATLLLRGDVFVDARAHLQPEQTREWSCHVMSVLREAWGGRDPPQLRGQGRSEGRL